MRTTFPRRAARRQRRRIEPFVRALRAKPARIDRTFAPSETRGGTARAARGRSSARSISPTKPAIGAPIAMASTAATRSLFVFIGECLLEIDVAACAGKPARATRARRVSSDRFAQRPEPRANFFGEELRLLPGGEVAALVELVVVDQFGIRPLRPAPRGWIELVREDAHGNRDGDALGVEEAQLVLPIETGAEKPPCSSTSRA